MSIKTITTVREYDEHGRVTKETVTEVEHTAPSPFPPDPWSTRPLPGWWQNPVVSYTRASDNTNRIVPV